MYETIIGRGSFGEVWKAFSKKHNHIVILKRLFIEKGEKYHLSGRREIHFGSLLKGEKYITRFIDYFTVRNMNKNNELWLVYENEGLSLRSIIYNTNEDGFQILSVYCYYYYFFFFFFFFYFLLLLYVILLLLLL